MTFSLVLLLWAYSLLLGAAPSTLMWGVGAASGADEASRCRALCATLGGGNEQTAWDCIDNMCRTMYRSRVSRFGKRSPTAAGAAAAAGKVKGGREDVYYQDVNEIDDGIARRRTSDSENDAIADLIAKSSPLLHHHHNIGLAAGPLSHHAARDLAPSVPASSSNSPSDGTARAAAGLNFFGRPYPPNAHRPVHIATDDDDNKPEVGSDDQLPAEVDSMGAGEEEGEEKQRGKQEEEEEGILERRPRLRSMVELAALGRLSARGGTHRMEQLTTMLKRLLSKRRRHLRSTKTTATLRDLYHQHQQPMLLHALRGVDMVI